MQFPRESRRASVMPQGTNVDACAADQRWPANVIDLDGARFRAIARRRGLDVTMTVSRGNSRG